MNERVEEGLMAKRKRAIKTRLTKKKKEQVHHVGFSSSDNQFFRFR